MALKFEEAWDDALKRHHGQLYGSHDYGYHLRMVVEKLQSIGAGLVKLVAGALHDTIEAGATRAELAERYGEEVAELVWAVSHEGGNRAEQARCIVTKLWLCHGAIDIKLADRCCNMRNCFDEGKWKLFAMYLKEVDVYRPVFALGHPVLYAEFLELAARAIPK